MTRYILRRAQRARLLRESAFCPVRSTYGVATDLFEREPKKVARSDSGSARCIKETATPEAYAYERTFLRRQLSHARPIRFIA